MGGTGGTCPPKTQSNFSSLKSICAFRLKPQGEMLYTYTSKTVQNEDSELLVFSRLLINARFFSVLADETQERAKR